MWRVKVKKLSDSLKKSTSILYASLTDRFETSCVNSPFPELIAKQTDP